MGKFSFYQIDMRKKYIYKNELWFLHMVSFIWFLFETVPPGSQVGPYNSLCKFLNIDLIVFKLLYRHSECDTNDIIRIPPHI